MNRTEYNIPCNIMDSKEFRARVHPALSSNLMNNFALGCAKVTGTFHSPPGPIKWKEHSGEINKIFRKWKKMYEGCTKKFHWVKTKKNNKEEKTRN